MISSSIYYCIVPIVIQYHAGVLPELQKRYRIPLNETELFTFYKQKLAARNLRKSEQPVLQNVLVNSQASIEMIFNKCVTFVL